MERICWSMGGDNLPIEITSFGKTVRSGFEIDEICTIDESKCDRP